MYFLSCKTSVPGFNSHPVLQRIIDCNPQGRMDVRKETDSLGEVDVPSGKLWGAQTQRSLDHFSIGHDLIPREMIAAYAVLKRAAAAANHAGGRLGDQAYRMMVRTCDEILEPLGRVVGIGCRFL